MKALTGPQPIPSSDPGRLCSGSFASYPENHTDPVPDAPGWGRCRTCGEVVNTRGDRVPEHLAGGARDVKACIYDGCTTRGNDHYMAVHTARPHVQCVCGWVGTWRKAGWHLVGVTLSAHRIEEVTP